MIRRARRPRARSFGRDTFASGGINLTPLLDILFNLIFFFILATRIQDRERLMEITLPPSTTAQEQEPPKDVPEVQILPDGKLLFDGESLTEDDLRERLRVATEEGGVEEVLLAADQDVTWRRIIAITDLCREAGVRQVLPRLADGGGGGG